MNTLCLQNMIKVAKRTWMFWPRHIVIYHSLGDEHPITSSFWVTNTSLQTTHMANWSTQKCMDDQRWWFPVLNSDPSSHCWLEFSNTFMNHLCMIMIWLCMFFRSQGMFVLVMSDCPGSPIFARRLGGEAAEFPSPGGVVWPSNGELWWIKGDIMWYHVISTIWHEMDGITWDNNCLKKDCLFFHTFPSIWRPVGF